MNEKKRHFARYKVADFFLHTQKYGCGSYPNCRSFCFLQARRCFPTTPFHDICRVGIAADVIPLVLRIL